MYETKHNLPEHCRESNAEGKPALTCRQSEEQVLGFIQEDGEIWSDVDVKQMAIHFNPTPQDLTNTAVILHSDSWNVKIVPLEVWLKLFLGVWPNLFISTCIGIISSLSGVKCAVEKQTDNNDSWMTIPLSRFHTVSCSLSSALSVVSCLATLQR